jgi:hypothetical protein
LRIPLSACAGLTCHPCRRAALPIEPLGKIHQFDGVELQEVQKRRPILLLKIGMLLDEIRDRIANGANVIAEPI